MIFTLVYEGELKSQNKSTKEHKHRIREAFSVQLLTLWDAEPLASRRKFALGLSCSDPVELFTANLEDRAPKPDISLVQEVGDRYFLPVITQKLHLTAEISITWVRKEDPGNLIGVGDIDNRLKTLIDALQTPPLSQLPDTRSSTDANDPFLTVLEDDCLVTKIAVNTVRDLRGRAAGPGVLLLIEVKSTVSVPTEGNMHML